MYTLCNCRQGEAAAFDQDAPFTAAFRRVPLPGPQTSRLTLSLASVQGTGIT